MHSSDNYRVTAPERPRQTPPRDRIVQHIGYISSVSQRSQQTPPCLMCTMPTLSPSPHRLRRVDDGSGGGPLLGWPGQQRNAVPTPAARVASSQQRCADRKNLIRVSPRSLTKDPRRRTLAICILQSAVRPHLNATPIAYSQYK